MASFLAFVQHGLGDLIAPEDILDGAKTVDARLERIMKKTPPRIDLLSAICTRLALHVGRRTKALKKKELDSLRAFLSHELLPEDMRLALAQELGTLPSKLGLQKLFGDPKLARLLLALKTGR